MAATSEAPSSYSNDDIAPVPPSARRWGMRDIAVLWVSMCACIPTYMLASSLIAEGMDWKQAVATIFLGNCVVLVPMILNGHAGARYGIPFPVYCRASFGVRGANLAALLRAFVACGWFGIQTWIGGAAIFKLLGAWRPALDSAPAVFAGLSLPQLACFLFFWGVNMFVIHKGVDSIRVLLNVQAPLILSLGLALLYWAWRNAGGFGPILSAPSAFAAGQAKAGKFWEFFFPALTAMVGFWATLSLNIPDFTRYARSQRDQILGQALALPAAMGIFSFIGIAVTSATAIIYGKSLWDPVVVLSKFGNPLVLAVAMASLGVATLGTNIAANVVSPANDFAHLWPSRIDFRTGGYLTGIIGVLIQPWKLVADPNGYIFKWLVAYSCLLGAVGGVLICDYYWIRRTHIELSELYSRGGRYWYRGGVNPKAIAAFALGVLPLGPGFGAAVGLWRAGPFWVSLYHYAWFVGFAVSFIAYALMTRREGAPPVPFPQRAEVLTPQA